MKTKKILALLLVAVAISAQAQQKKVVEQPPAMFANTPAVEINKVTLSDTETVLDVNAYFRPGYWIRIVSDTYLLADGKKYMVRTGEGITLDSLFWMPQSGEAEFKLTFEPLPKNTQSFDFIESDCDDCFKIYGIDLVHERLPLAAIPAEYTREHNPETDIDFDLQKGEAVVSGRFLGYLPALKNTSLTYSNPITGSEESVPVEINPDGTFKASITVYSPTNVMLHNKAASAPIKVAPGKESKIIINLPERYRAQSRLHRDSEPYGKPYYYAGYLARLNTDLMNKELSFALQEDYTQEIADMDINAYKDFLMDKYHTTVSHNNSLNISPLAKTIVNMENALEMQNKLLMSDYYLIQAYAQKHKLSEDEARKTFKPGEPSKDFNNYYLLIPNDKPEMLLINGINYRIGGLIYARENNLDPFEVLRYLSENENVEASDQEFFKKFILSQETGEEFKEASSINKIFTKYQDLGNEYMKQKTGVGFLSQVWKTDKSFLFDLMKAQNISADFKNFTPLSDEKKTEIATLPPVIRDILFNGNEKLLARIEENKKKTGFTVLNPPTNVDEQLFVDLLKPFAGKVILVDVWATWCGPCRAANKEMEPLKAQFADKDLVFLYLAGEDSSENTWKNMITDMKGHHYRVNQAQWDYLRKSLNANGVPTYIIIDREGNHSFHSAGFPGVDAMRRELNKALSKQ